MELVQLDEIKQHLNIDESFHDDDNYLYDLICVAEDAVRQHLNIKDFSDLIDHECGSYPMSVIQAVKLLVGNLYNNREPVTTGTVVKVPYTYEYLLSLYKNYDIK